MEFKIEVKNVMEDLVWENLDRVMSSANPACDCALCRADIVAFALNHLKPRYAATSRGETISKAAVLSNQFRMDVIAALTSAISTVGKKPRHPMPAPDEKNG
ncbi:MAG: late competence development ComFB family protein [Solirubrobacterales bacterium]